jgi:hypothetical protein
MLPNDSQFLQGSRFLSRDEFPPKSQPSLANPPKLMKWRPWNNNEMSSLLVWNCAVDERLLAEILVISASNISDPVFFFFLFQISLLLCWVSLCVCVCVCVWITNQLMSQLSLIFSLPFSHQLCCRALCELFSGRPAMVKRWRFDVPWARPFPSNWPSTEGQLRAWHSAPNNNNTHPIRPLWRP